jgi:hypothetical protein
MAMLNNQMVDIKYYISSIKNIQYFNTFESYFHFITVLWKKGTLLSLFIFMLDPSRF